MPQSIDGLFTHVQVNETNVCGLPENEITLKV